MLSIYGIKISSPTNKVIYLANYLSIPYKFNEVNLLQGEHRKSEFLKLSPYAKVPIINDGGFILAESNSIIRYLAKKHPSQLYPKDMQQQSIIDQWMDYASQQIATATSRVMFNLYYYKLKNGIRNEVSLDEDRKLLQQYLSVVEQQLIKYSYIADNNITLADFSLLAALDVCEMGEISLENFPQIQNWRKSLMQESFYTRHHSNYADSFCKTMELNKVDMSLFTV